VSPLSSAWYFAAMTSSRSMPTLMGTISGTRKLKLYSCAAPYGLRSVGIARLYVHDDRFGPYARMTWVPRQDANAAEELPRLSFAPYDAGYDEFEQPVSIHEAYVPLYPKLRMSATDLVLMASQLLPLVRFVAGEGQRDELLVDLRFVLNGRYLSEAHGFGLSPDRTEQLVSTLLLPRYIGVIRFSVGDRRFLDILCDTTDIPRAPPAWAPVLAFIPADEGLKEALKKFAAKNGDASVI
ncbi:hypothetical protein, partial [Hyalangium versicolor]|uniref:hypothetical protein n=1 Tax=Hyalangium versicolor TaxID=2861190 RepID=UPI001CCF6B3A